MKEFRVYILSADALDISAYDIENWVLYAEQHNKLTEEAKEFVKIAEEQDSVYSLYGFQMAFNLEQAVGMNDWVFITNAY